MMIAVSEIKENGNMRRVPATEAADQSLADSIKALGVLEPVLVRPNPAGGYLLIAGYRRLSVARRLGLEEIPAEVKLFSDVEAEVAQAAENMVRLDPDPVDRWRHICRLIEDGYSKESAGAALGLSDRAVGQLSKLGRLAPAVLDALVGSTLPPWKTLGEIAQAPHERQIEAFDRHRLASGYVAWNSVAGECLQRRVSKDHAIFDIEASGIVFEEDFFAEPGSPEQFTTTNLLEFMRAQRAAVLENIEEGREPALLVDFDPIRALPKIPAGWTFADFGDARTITKRSKQKRLYAVIPATEYRDGGKVVSILIKEISSKAGAQEEVGESESAFEETDDQGVDEESASEIADDEMITRAGHDMLASIRLEALKRALRRDDVYLYHKEIMASLVLQLIGGRYDCRDLVAAIVGPEGQPLPVFDATLSPTTLIEIAAEALARSVNIWPRHNQAAHGRESDTQKAEWIGMLVDADDQMPALDTPEVFAHVGGEGLRKIAADHLSPDISPKQIPKKISELRGYLAGKASDWKPMHFGCPGPTCEPWTANFPQNDTEAA